MTLSTDKINKEQKVKQDTIDKLRKFLEEKQGKFPQMEPYRPPSWFKRINPETLPKVLERRYKNFISKKYKRGIRDKDMANAKDGQIKVYAKGGGVRKTSY